jgi:hypothetical protein
MAASRLSLFTARLLSTSTSTSSAAAASAPLVYKNQVLSRETVQRFDKDGFLVLEDLLTDKEKSDVFRWTEEIQAWPETKGLFSLSLSLSLSLSNAIHLTYLIFNSFIGKWFLYYEKVNGQKTLCRTENFLPYHEGIRNLIHGKLSKVMSDLFRDHAVLFKEKINYKLAGAAGKD